MKRTYNFCAMPDCMKKVHGHALCFTHYIHIWNRVNKKNEKPYQRYAVVKNHAKTRCIPFLISKDDFFKLLQLDCHYCKGFFVRTKTAGFMDRIDNNKGYTVENVLPCCGTCNSIRGDKLTVHQTEVAILAIIEDSKNGK